MPPSFHRIKRTPEDGVLDATIKTGILLEEIKILDPHIVLLHTGPKYEKWLDEWFLGLSRQGDQWLARLKAPDLPDRCLCYRTYHPSFLNRQKDIKKPIQIYRSILEDLDPRTLYDQGE